MAMVYVRDCSKWFVGLLGYIVTSKCNRLHSVVRVCA